MLNYRTSQPLSIRKIAQDLVDTNVSYWLINHVQRLNNEGSQPKHLQMVLPALSSYSPSLSSTKKSPFSFCVIRRSLYKRPTARLNCDFDIPKYFLMAFGSDLSVNGRLCVVERSNNVSNI